MRDAYLWQVLILPKAVGYCYPFIFSKMATTLDDLMKMMKDHNTKLDTIQKDIAESTKEIKQYVDKKLEAFNTSIVTIEEKLSQQETYMNNLQKQLVEREIADKKRNIILHKIAENEKSQDELIDMVLSIFKTKLNLEASKGDVDFVFRMGKKSNTARPILLGCTTLILKENIMRQKNKLIAENIGVSDDFPQIVREKRKTLAPTVKALFEKGYKVHIKQDTMVVNGERWSLEKANEVINSCKRSSSAVSPIEQDQNQTKKQNNLRINTTGKFKSTQVTPVPSPSTPSSMKQYLLTNGKVLTPKKNEQISDFVSFK